MHTRSALRQRLYEFLSLMVLAVWVVMLSACSTVPPTITTVQCEQPPAGFLSPPAEMDMLADGDAATVYVAYLNLMQLRSTDAIKLAGLQKWVKGHQCLGAASLPSAEAPQEPQPLAAPDARWRSESTQQLSELHLR